jgi:flagellar protein FliS
MPPLARNHYLETEVLTATPQKLHLLLIEAAMRFAERARRHWREGNREKAFQSLILAQDAVTKMLNGLSHENPTPLVQEVASVYNFIFRTLVDANCRHDERKLDEALRVLAVERETWRLVCQQNVEPPMPPEEHPAVPPPLSHGFHQAASSSFSWEA